MSPTSICNVPGCPLVATSQGRCLQHAKPAWAGSTRRRSLPRDWPRLRLQVLDRDQWRCRCDGCPRCAGDPCATTASDVDHIGDRDDHGPGNLRSMCGPCHRHKTSSSVRRGWS